MRVVEIFTSIDGEGKRTGLPTTFIRLFGCNLKCAFCDTRYGCEGNDYDVMKVSDIVEEVKRRGVMSVTVTGGEPLIHEDISVLLLTLAQAGFDVNVETNGTCVPKVIHDNIFYTVDYKCGASKMSDKMNPQAFEVLCNRDVIKFVVGSIEDLEQAEAVVDHLLSHYVASSMPQVYISPVFGAITPKEIVDFILEHKMYNCKAQVQLHKIIWKPDERGV